MQRFKQNELFNKMNDLKCNGTRQILTPADFLVPCYNSTDDIALTDSISQSIRILLLMQISRTNALEMIVLHSLTSICSSIEARLEPQTKQLKHNLSLATFMIIPSEPSAFGSLLSCTRPKQKKEKKLWRPIFMSLVFSGSVLK